MQKEEMIIQQTQYDDGDMNCDEFTVYSFFEYKKGDSLEGQEGRKWHDAFDTLDEAKKAYPKAVLNNERYYQRPSVNHLPDYGDLSYESESELCRLDEEWDY